MRNIFFIIGLVFLMLSSCRSHRQVVQQATTDSSSVTFREVEKIVNIPGDTVKLKMQAQWKTDFEESRVFVPQTQTVESKNSKVELEINSVGEIKVEAIMKDRAEKVILLEKTIATHQSEVTVLEQKEPWFKLALKGLSRTFKTVVITVLVILGLYAFLRLRL